MQPEHGALTRSKAEKAGHASYDIPMAVRPMFVEDIPEVVDIETKIFPFPWSPTGFSNAISNGYDCRVMFEEASGKIAGYFIIKYAVDEAQLLSIGLKAALQGMGYGRFLLENVVGTARGRGMKAVILEVRPSNLGPLALYQNFGFRQIGIRRNYYPDVDNLREDGIIMEFSLES